METKEKFCINKIDNELTANYVSDKNGMTINFDTYPEAEKHIKDD